MAVLVVAVQRRAFRLRQGQRGLQRCKASATGPVALGSRGLGVRPGGVKVRSQVPFLYQFLVRRGCI